MIEIPNVSPRVIQNHYDLLTPFYRLMWGPHIHHGLWESDESPQVAQLQLTERLATLAGIEAGLDIVDIGCGMGGSSRWLAAKKQCRVTGVTISPVQRRWAATAAALQRCQPRPKFICQDAEECEFGNETFDIVWSIECTEHLFQKANFFRQAAGWLRPGGRMAVCAWLAGENESSPETIKQVRQVCEGMFCPSLGTQMDYETWFAAAGLKVTESQLWTPKVMQTWEICKRRVDRSGVRWVARMLGKNHTLFLDHFDAILNAYKSGAMEYGCFVAEKVS